MTNSTQTDEARGADTIHYTNPFSGARGNLAAYSAIEECMRALYAMTTRGGRGTYYNVGGTLYGPDDLYRIYSGALDAIRLADPTQRAVEADDGRPGGDAA